MKDENNLIKFITLFFAFIFIALMITFSGCSSNRVKSQKSYEKMTGAETVKYNNKMNGNCSICEKKGRRN